jgi:Uma2 family endonuclease
VNAPPKIRMSAKEFLTWGETQSEGRFELVEGEVVVMSPERARHNLVKGAVYIALVEAVNRIATPCTVFTDGIGIQTGPDTIREPDASVQLGRFADLDKMVLDAPIILVEVLSPSSERSDAGEKLAEYFSIPSVMHYLIVCPKQKYCYHHKRIGQDKVLTTIVRDGSIEFNPPGLSVALKDIFGEVDR